MDDNEQLDEHPDPHVQAIEKCKPGPHIRVIVGSDPTAHGAADQVVREVEDLVCRNHVKGEPPWGAVIDPTGKLQGMQLLKSAMLVVEHQFPVVAKAARSAPIPHACVALQHTVEGDFHTWRSFTPDTADGIGAAVAAIIAAHE